MTESLPVVQKAQPVCWCDRGDSYRKAHDWDTKGCEGEPKFYTEDMLAGYEKREQTLKKQNEELSNKIKRLAMAIGKRADDDLSNSDEDSNEADKFELLCVQANELIKLSDELLGLSKQ